MAGNLIVGAHAVLHINGMPYAYVSQLNPTITSPQKEIRGIDYLLPFDAAPGPLSYSVSAQIYRNRSHVGLEGEGLVPTWDKATRGKYFSAIIMDRITSTVLFESQRNLVTGQSWSIGKGFVIGQVAWQGLGYTNDSSSFLT
jgi:hypothetical protein